MLAASRILGATDQASCGARDALAVKREQGVRLGRPQALPGDVVQRIVAARRAGASFRAIAAQLEMDGVPTARGGPTWHASAVRAVCESQAARRPG
jgi:Recombinase